MAVHSQRICTLCRDCHLILTIFLLYIFLQIYFPHQNDATYGPVVHHIHKRSPGVLITSKLASLSALKGLLLAKAAGLGGATVIGKKKAAFQSAKTLKALSTLAFVGR